AAGVQISIHKGSAVLWLVGSGAWLLSGALFPTSALPHAVKLISQLVPFTHSLSGMRFALLAGNSVNLARELELLAFYSVLLVPASLAFFCGWSVRRARTERCPFTRDAGIYRRNVPEDAARAASCAQNVKLLRSCISIRIQAHPPFIGS